MIYFGDHSYAHEPIEKFEPIVNVGKFTSIAGFVQFYGAPHHPPAKYRKCVSSYPFHERLNCPSYYRCLITRHEKRDINIGNDVWICDNALIMDGITIGDGAIVGARAVVTHDIPPYAMVVGIPARIKKYRFTPEQIKALQKIKWWDWDYLIIRERIEDFKDIDVFIEKYGNTAV
jgi:acetyltransferase-like isoleucine patch superfamily enzyme